jgi:hypothetical protein
MPTKAREKLDVGVEPKTHDTHTVTGGLLSPIVRSLAHLKPLPSSRAALSAKGMASA